jgi:hypothetical protein
LAEQSSIALSIMQSAQAGSEARSVRPQDGVFDMSLPWRTRRGIGRLAHIPLETEEQANIFDWAYKMQRQIPELSLLFAIPGQGVARLKRLQVEGYQPGIPDMMLPVARAVDVAFHDDRMPLITKIPVVKHGLFIELKRTKGGKVSPEQYEWIAKLEAQGYKCVVARGAEEARQFILEYLGRHDREE